VVTHGIWYCNRLAIFILLGFLSCLPVSIGEEIVLKNGTSITVDRVEEKDTEVIYQLGSTSYRIPKSSVVRIVRTPVSRVTIGAPSTMKITVATPKTGTWLPSTPEVATGGASQSVRPKLEAAPPSQAPGSAAEGALLQKFVVDGQVDERALSEFAKNSPSQIAAAANFLAGKFEMENGDPAAAPEYFDRAFKLAPEEPVLLGWYAAALIKIGKNADAIAAAKEALEKSPQSPEALQLLGTAYYNSDKTKEAVTAWKQSLELRADASVQRLVEKAKKELDSEESFREQQSEHFVVRYDGGKVSPELQRQILATLESTFRDLEKQFDFSPQQTIAVILYARQAFFDTTSAPAWAGGLYDGKLRIPVEGLQAMNPRLERVLRHELTHSFVTYLTRGNCATWLHEGLAQLMEPKNSSPEKQQLAALFKRSAQFPLQTLERSFTGLTDDQARVAYAESLVAVEYLRSKYGMDDLLSILQGLAQGRNTQAALKATIRSDYDQFEKELGDSLSGSLAGAAPGEYASH
jgi:tetratricopeptide (TPR) repeat protein